MIDTDKYEGHTPADDWEKHLVDALFETEFPMTYQDNQLIADAPLLLAEVKRLRRAFRIATAHIGFGNHLGHAELRRALNSMGIDYNSLPWAEEEWEEPLPTFGGVAHYD